MLGPVFSRRVCCCAILTTIVLAGFAPAGARVLTYLKAATSEE